jgi:post-segregation antitoxin (ccd killing protein)
MSGGTRKRKQPHKPVKGPAGIDCPDDSKSSASPLQLWQSQNREAIAAFSRYIERHGIFGDVADRGF